MKTKVSVFVCLLLIVPFLVFAQGSSEEQKAAEEDDVEVTIVSRWSEEIPSSIFFREHLTKMSNNDNGITIIQDHVNDEMSYYDKLRTKFATGEFPNVFFDYGGARTIDYVKSGILVDLKQYLDAAPEWRDGFMPLFDKWEYEDYPGIWGVPAEFYAVGIFYNKEIFDEVGIQPPETMKEFEDISDKLLEAGYIPLALGEKDIWRAGHFSNNIILKKYGAQAVTDLAKRSLAYDSPEMIEVYEMIQDYYERGYFGPNPVNMDYNMEKTAFHTGETAMHMDGSWYLGEGTQSPIGDNIGVFPFPAINPKYKNSWQGGAAGGFSVVDTGNEKEIEAAIEIIKSITIPEYMKKLQRVNEGGVYPVKFTPDKSVVGDLTIEYMDLIQSAEEFRDDIQTYDPLSSLLETVRLALQGLFVGKTPQECANEIVAEIEARE
ncbi:MAG: extracellular solute-binding protein [Spirochaetia bacterium]|nr:extracellular solute-binding protein [Spirochaetia bacterium]MCF7946861.1 extracellular solute-binding protein [Spirochaetia bacterium]